MISFFVFNPPKAISCGVYLRLGEDVLVYFLVMQSLTFFGL